MQENGIEVLDWPSSSPDLNPIENLWAIMKRKLRNDPQRTTSALKDKIQEIWDLITPEECKNLIVTMPKRIDAVLKSKGGKKQIINTILLLFVSNCVKSDERTYLPPLGNKLNNGYLPPANNNPEHSRNLQPTQIIKGAVSYKYNKPGVIDDPLPKRVDYVQPLGLDFASGKYKPISKGALISGLFFNENVAQILNRETENETPLNNAISGNGKPQFLNAKTSETSNLFTPKPKLDNALNSLNYNNSKAENTRQINKFVRNHLEDVVPINYYVEKVFKYKLFNYDDMTELSDTEPVVIFKPGDDIRFTEDTTIIDNYEHMFPVEKLKKPQKSSPLIVSTTTSTAPAPIITYDTHTIEATKHQISSEEKSESNRTGNGYIYEKPKIAFTF
ncbi:uncharacterized protein LOC135954163 [Calliphora vicina]|uniref:uncharacterized protein LOC135954163 n=1 Tax=Calliphora vicina TaxID=7373 RepID=UPI00325C2AD1